MKSAAVLRLSLCAWLGAYALAVINPAWLSGELPDVLRQYVATRPAPQLSVGAAVLLAIGAVFLVGAPICAVGLLFLKHWARLGLTFIYLLNIVGVAFLGPSVRTGLENSVGEFGVVAIGFALGVAWFSDALKQGPVHDA